MKNLLYLSIVLIVSVMGGVKAQAQTVTEVKQIAKQDFGMIPASLTYGGKSLFVFGYNGKGDGEEFDDELNIMDSSFNDLKTLTLPKKEFQWYSISYDAKFNYFRDYERSQFEQLPFEDYTDAPLSTEKEILEFFGTDRPLEVWNADTLLVVLNEWDNPTVVEKYGYYFVRSNSKRFANYHVYLNKVYSGEHEPNGEKTEGSVWKRMYLPTYFYDVDNYDDEDHRLAATQTLFNSDEKFEYLRPDYETCFSDGWYNEWEGKYVERYYVEMKSVSIVQDDGTVLGTIHKTPGRYIQDVYVVKSYDEPYILVEEYDVEEDNHEITVVYKWNSNGAGISRVKELKGMRAYPNPAHKNDMVTVDIPENVHNGMLIVSNSTGQTLQSQKLNGQRKVEVSTSRMSSGIYNVTLVSEGKSMQTSRIVVK